MLSVEKRFWAKVQKTDSCWLWTGDLRRDGYGRFCLNGKRVRAHRIAWQLERGRIATDECVLHSCDTPACVRPDHLFLGDRVINNADCVRKRRHAFGSVIGKSKLIDGDVDRIRDMLRARYAQYQIAEWFGVSQQTISRIARRSHWTHVP
jgi:hypothetical protein